ncbi:hypothetical protein EVAR_91164_1 [Eumeta japonica]|uniref:Uncharacterized protein n=1 Tax=Eumeta variegata TaxID=151549 RepID=A0A4C2A377_EUMVA|nr:hypothetical protein EVAR_91164_1 [Eumeta japonica]
MCRHRNHGFQRQRYSSTAPAGSLRECAVIETMASAPYVALLPTAPAGSLRECHRNHGFSAVRSVTINCAGAVVYVNVPSSKPWLQRLYVNAVIETMASAPYVALLPTAPAGGLRECAVIETMASAPYVALLPTAPAGSLRECAVIETMASARRK